MEVKDKMQVSDKKLRLMVFESAKDLGLKIDEHLLEKYKLNKDQYTFIIPAREYFFSDGHMKTEINSTVRGMDIFALTDIGNYSITYKMHGQDNHMSPNDHIQQLKDGIGACNSHADKINIIIPLLYAGRQHRRNTRENLLCGSTLHEFELNRHFSRMLVFDAHDQGVEHALHNTEFDNVMATNIMIENFLDDASVDELRNITFISPDNGANGRRNIVMNSMNVEENNVQAGSFYKQRDYNRFVDGKNPIISHDYSGNENLQGRTAIIVDDMISSGGSMFDCIEGVKKRGAEKVYIMTTYALFTNGIDEFNKYYENGLLDGVYTTNLSYIPDDYQKQPWLHVCDCSRLVADLIFNIHNDLSIAHILRDKSEPKKMLQKKFQNNS